MSTAARSPTCPGPAFTTARRWCSGPGTAASTSSSWVPRSPSEPGVALDARLRLLRRGDPGAAAGERPLAADPAPLALAQTAPDAELLAVDQRVLEAVGAH